MAVRLSVIESRPVTPSCNIAASVRLELDTMSPAWAPTAAVKFPVEALVAVPTFTPSSVVSTSMSASPVAPVRPRSRISLTVPTGGGCLDDERDRERVRSSRAEGRRGASTWKPACLFSDDSPTRSP